MKLINYKDMSKLINIAIATAKIKSLEIPHRKIRPFMHLLLYGRIGGGKSTILWDVANKLNAVPIMNLTRATLIGTVDKTTGNFIPPAVWDARNSVLLIDELFIDRNSPERGMLRNLLTLMENPYFEKRMGYRCNDFKEGNMNDLYCVVEKNIIKCKTRFVFFANTMQNLEKTQMIELHSLKTRCLTIPYYPSLEDTIRKAKGEPFFVYQKLKCDGDIKISKRTYNKIMKFTEDKNITVEHYLRTIGNLCRAYAVVGFDKKIFDLICDLATI